MENARKPDPARHRATEIRRLHDLEQKAVDTGVRLEDPNRLVAAFHLTRAWSRASEAGMLKQDFQDQVLDRLQRPHASRQEFRLSNWKLKRDENPLTQDLRAKYKGKSTPQKNLEPYLVGLAVAAEHCSADPDEWKLAMVRDLSIWLRPVAQLDVAPPDDRPAETLAILIKALCERLAIRNRLGDTFDAISSMNCMWDMFAERLLSTKQNCMQRNECPVFPANEDCLYFEEMYPFPSVPLLRVPYAFGRAQYALSSREDARLSSLDELRSITGGHAQESGATTEVSTGGFTWFREIRLAIVRDGQGGFTSALETRPYLEVLFETPEKFAGRHHVIYGCDIPLWNSLFYGQTEDGGAVYPMIRAENGEYWRLQVQALEDGGELFTELTERYSNAIDWGFDPEPISAPGEVYYEPWYLSYTPATAPYLRHWLTQNWRLQDSSRSQEERADRFGKLAVCPWNPENVDWDYEDTAWIKNVPPLNELNFPDFSHATWVESCLHNNLIEQALQASIDRLQEQTAQLQTDWRAARERHTNALLRRWKTEDKKLGS